MVEAGPVFPPSTKPVDDECVQTNLIGFHAFVHYLAQDESSVGTNRLGMTTGEERSGSTKQMSCLITCSHVKSSTLWHATTPYSFNEHSCGISKLHARLKPTKRSVRLRRGEKIASTFFGCAFNYRLSTFLILNVYLISRKFLGLIMSLKSKLNWISIRTRLV